ncbi:MAG: hypothetical protein P1P90_01090 [Patescibacteria group bacterium]|nr:hypothetical protein [Patescibacteria group bacterium]
MTKALEGDKPMWQFSYAFACANVFLVTLLAHRFLTINLYILPTEVFWIETVLGVVLICLMILSMVRKKVSTMWWEVMLIVIAFAGVWIFAISLLPMWKAVLFASVLTVVAFFWQNAYASNLFYLIGSIGIGLLATWNFSELVMVVLASGVLLYDYYRSKEMGMATLYFEARKSGLVPGILLPINIIGWIKSKNQVWRPGEGQVVGILPFIALVGLCFHVLVGFSVWHFLFFCIFVIVFGLWFGIDAKYRLRSWVFLGSSILIFSIFYIVDLL